MELACSLWMVNKKIFQNTGVNNDLKKITVKDI